MFFEGSEKKAEIIINSKHISLLRDFEDSFWSILVSKCDAKILSVISNDSVKAFLLSESSLFVWNDRILILTCGDTMLVNSVKYLLEHIDSNYVKQVIYQRKNEYCSHLQSSHVLDDTKILQKLNAGRLLRFGQLDSHHSYLYHLDNDYKGDPNDKTYELLIYNIIPELSKILTEPGIKSKDIRRILQLEEIIPGFQIDDFVFEPFGYSLNAISGADYFTVHLTPQEHNSYVSFESNINLGKFIPIILNIFQPNSFDLITYNETDFKQYIEKLIPSNYNAKALVEKMLNCDYLVNFASFDCVQTNFTLPVEIDLTGDSYEF